MRIENPTETGIQHYLLVERMEETLRHVQTQIVKCGENESIDEGLSFYYKQLGCNSIDIVEFNEELDLIVDDEGLLVSNNPVFEIPSKLYKDNLHIAGSFLIGKRLNIRGGGSETVGFSDINELTEAINQADFRLRVFGQTK